MEELRFISNKAPESPYASVAITPLRSKAEAIGKADFTPLWAGENRSGCKKIAAVKLVDELWRKCADTGNRISN